MPPTPENGWGVKGNTTFTKALHQEELDKAALAARQKKALMNSMASVSKRPPTLTTAEQYLEYHKPAVPRSPEGADGSSSIPRSNPYVPEFENGESRTGRAHVESSPASPPPSTVSSKEKKGGLFGLFRTKEAEPDFPDAPPTAPLPPAASYPEPNSEGIGAPTQPTPTAMETNEPDPAAREAALNSATAGTAESKRPSIFGRLFTKQAEPSAAPSATSPSTDPSPGISPAPAPQTEPTGIPSPPSLDSPAPAEAPAPTAPATTTASIFVNRNSPTAAGSSATVLGTTQATVSGVLVRLYEGTSVTLLERNGSMARIRLPDGREGTVAASALSR